MTFNIVRYHGDPKRATTLTGHNVTRQERLFIPEYGSFVTCAPYDNHFVFENPDKQTEGSAYLCTCGSPAVIVPPGPTGMLVCLFDATYGQHQTSFINKKDFSNVAGKTVEIAGKRTKVK